MLGFLGDVGDLAKLVASILVTVFALGLYLTRRPRYRAMAEARALARVEARTDRRQSRLGGR